MTENQRNETMLMDPVKPLLSLLSPSGRMQRFRIGLFGLLPPQVLTWDRRNLEGRIAMIDMVEAARASIATLRAQGADLVIAL